MHSRLKRSVSRSLKQRLRFLQPANPDLDEQITRMHHERATLERRVVVLESQLRNMADSRWLKFGRRLGFGPKVD
jgi:hypothetical protein